MRNQDLGANISQTLVIKGAGSSLSDSAYRNAYGSFKNELLQTTGIKSVTTSTSIMGEEILWSTNWKKLSSSDKQEMNLFHVGIDNDFIGSYHLKLLAGRAFSTDYGNERKAVILNESAVRTLGISSPEAAIGELLSGGQNNMDSLKVVGVLADFHQEGLQKAIQPLVFFYNHDWRANYSVKIQGANPAVVIGTIKKIWAQHFPADPYDYFFLDEFFDRQYAENQRFGSVFALFAILAIGIACFGLLGLSAYNVLQRTKEIGIRKVLGASVRSLLFVLSKDFLVLVTVAFVVIVPVIGIAMGGWLQGFVYRVGISWWIYGISGALAILIALLTVGIQALKASLANPVKSLRTE
jgi:putative ABC transport system permease protein